MAYFSFLFSFRGRLNRARFLVVQLALLAFWFTLPKFVVDFSPQWEAWVVVTAMIWISMATTARRLHDRGRNGWWAVAVLFVNHLAYAYCGLFFGLTFGVDISIVKELLLVMLAIALSLLQTWAIIELFFMVGADGPNRFGPDPTRSAPNSPIVSRAASAGVPDFLVLGAGPLPRSRYLETVIVQRSRAKAGIAFRS